MTTTNPGPDLTPGRRRLILAICCMSLLLVSIDVTIVNVALPSIQHDLHASVSGLQWIIDAYTLVLASLLLLSGSTADRLGRRRIFQVGLTLFTLGSLLCSVAPSLGWLVAFRAVQAVGGSMLNPVAMSIITNVFTEPGERARAIGVWGAVVGVSLGLGPVLGGVLVDSIGWRSIFWVNIPVGIAALVLTALFVPESRAARSRRLDPVAQLLVIGVLVGLSHGIIEGPRQGWSSPEIVSLLAAAVVGLLVLVGYEARRHEPLVDVRFFRSAPFSGAAAMAAFGFGGFGGFLFLNTLYLQDVRHYSALQAGLCTLPTAVMAFVLSPWSGRITARRGPRIPLAVAGIAMTAAPLMLTRLTPTTPLAWLLASYLLLGIGFGMLNAPITNTAVSGMPRAQAGVAAAIASTSRQVGQSLGVAVVGSVAGAGAVGALGTGFAHASHPGWWVVVGCGVGVLSVGLTVSGVRGRASADRTAERLLPARAVAAR
ncbi:MFS transporter [Acidothermaceae bacterium B102]|nr:MFS transporter [Acidothermaceae bacterium B102]